MGPTADARVPSVLFLGFLVTAVPGVDWLDVGELTASAWDLGVSHPPGQPLPTLLWRLAMLLPLGSVVYRASIVSCVCAAAVCLPLWSIAVLLGRRLPECLRPIFPWCVCVAALLGVAAWAQAVRPEVYAPQLLIAVAVVAASLTCATGEHPARVRASIVVVALLGLSGATHSLLAVGLIPAAFTGLVCCGRAALKEAAPRIGLAAVVVTGLHLYLPLRSAARPELAWGMPHTPDGFWGVITGRAFTHNFSPTDGEMVSHNLGVVGEVLISDLGPMVLALAVTGVVLIFATRSVGAILALAITGNLSTVLAQNKVFAANPDLLGYLALASVLLALVAVFALFHGLGWLATRGWERPAVLGAWLFVVALGLNGVFAGITVDRSRNRLAENHGRALLDGLPPGAVLLTSGNNSAFVGCYQRRVERRRPDLVVFHRTLLGHPFYELALRREHGDPPAGIDTTALRQDARAALAAGRAVAVEIREPDLSWFEQLAPSGGVMYLSDGPVVLEPHLPRDQRLLERWRPRPDEGHFQRDADALQVTLYEGMLRASYFDLRGRSDLVDRELEVVHDMAPGFSEELPRPTDSSWWRER